MFCALFSLFLLNTQFVLVSQLYCRTTLCFVIRLSHCNLRPFTIAITSFSVYLLLQYSLIRYLFHPIYLMHSPIAQRFERFQNFFLSLLHITLSVMHMFLVYFIRTLAFVFSYDNICCLSQNVFHAVAILSFISGSHFTLSTIGVCPK